MAKPKTIKSGMYEFDRLRLRDADRSLYCFLQTAYFLKLISDRAFHHSTTVETNLLIPKVNSYEDY